MKLNDFTRVLENLYTEPESTKTKLNESLEEEKLNEGSLDDAGVYTTRVYQLQDSKEKFKFKGSKNIVQGKDLLDYFDPNDKLKIAHMPGEIDTIVDRLIDEGKELTEGFNDMMNIDKWDLLDWLGEHSQAWEDCCNYFGVPLELDEDKQFDQLLRTPSFELLNWVADHNMLYDDFQQFFGLDAHEEPTM